MLHDIIFLIIGLGLIIAGGNFVTNGATAVANKFKVSPLIIGLTIVAFGSSTPDLVVTLTSTIHGKTSLAVSDIVGACIFDGLLVIGITALIHPIKLTKSEMWCDLPIMTAGGALLFIVTQDRLIDGKDFNIISRADGVALLLLFAVSMFYTFSNAKKQDMMPARARAQLAKQQALPSNAASVPSVPSATATKAPAKQQASSKPMRMWTAAVLIVMGLAALVIGGNWIVDGASGVAKRAGWSDALIGLTIVGIGSSIPDLATSVIAAIKRQPGIAVGNIFGSIIIDLLFVLGLSSEVRPLDTGALTIVDFSVLVGSALLVWAFSGIFTKNRITRGEGAALVFLYVAYMTYLVMNVH